jgi:hypothetical protein
MRIFQFSPSCVSREEGNANFRECLFKKVIFVRHNIFYYQYGVAVLVLVLGGGRGGRGGRGGGGGGWRNRAFSQY